MPRKRDIQAADGDGPPPSVFMAAIYFLGAGMLELAMLLLFYGTYNETLGLMPGLYLCDLAALGALVCNTAPDMTVSNLLALLLAVFSVAVPIVIWNAVLDSDVLEDPGAWFDNPANKVWFVLGALVYFLVFMLETVNLYTLIAQHADNHSGVLITAQDPNPMMEALRDNKALGVFIAALIAVVNVVLAFIAVRSARTLKEAIRS